ncbi:hypothetical protein [Streptomyces sp. NPDC029041]|uniref:hypothetical protein n=1 Tax=Streptomyces sp. NPDC029041 TaxID=3155727 RepID=UPI0033C0E0FB
MHPIARTAPVVAPTGPRSPAAVVLAVVVTAVLAVLGLVTPPPGAPGTGASGYLTTADHLRYGGTPAGADQLRYGGTPAGADQLRYDGTPAAADHLRFAGARADDGCDAARVVRAATRHDQTHGEPPASRGHSGTCDRSTRPTSSPLPGPPGRTLRVLASQPRVDQDQGRAPPVFSGT